MSLVTLGQREEGTIPDDAGAEARRALELLHRTPRRLSLHALDGGLLLANRAAEGGGMAAGSYFDRFCDPSQAERALAVVGRGGVFYGEVLLRTPRGTGWYEVELTPCVDPASGRRAFVAAEIDVSRIHDLQEQLNASAWRDPLTELPNRALLVDRLGRLVARVQRHPDRRFGVLFLDLDRFKPINDTFGHAVGDEVLVGIARRIEAALRGSDTVGRLGGDEFVVLMEDVEDVSQVEFVCQRLLREVGRPFSVGGHALVVGVSIGAVVGGPGYTRGEDLLRDADTAMYRAKVMGRGRYLLFDSELHQEIADEMRLERELSQALDDGALALRFQPVFDLEGRRISEVEALIRWPHQERGLLLPSSFLRLAEGCGLMDRLGAWVLDAACRAARRWSDEGVAVPVAINLASRQLAHPELSVLVRDALTRTGLDPSLLRVEVHEEALHGDDDALANVVHLAELGVRLTLDDFGTGYTFLSRLGQLPVDAIKIDRFFVGGLHHERGRILLRGLLSLARGFGLRPVALGVEDAIQLGFLEAEGCRLAQGYHLCRPVSEEGLQPLLRGRLPV